MNIAKSHRFIATASTAAVSLTMLVAAGAHAQETTPADAVTAVAATGDAAPAANATQLQARIIDVSGKARWRPSADAEWKDAAVNDDLSPGAEIRTGMRSRVTLRFRNATVLVDSSTNFSIPTIEQEGDVLRTIAAVRSGRADFKVDKVGLQNDFKVVTPSTTLAVRGTSFSTISGPLKGVEIVGARENAIRAIEVRYAALNQTVEMSGGAESKSTSETPNPTEHALGNTFNAPQAGMIASKEEAQQGAFSGSSAPQTQRQTIATTGSVNQVKQDLAAAARGEGGNGTISLMIDIARAAGLRAVAQDAAALQAEPLDEVLALAGEARARFLELSAAADTYKLHADAAREAIDAARDALDAAEHAANTASGSAGEVVDAGTEALRSFALRQEVTVVRGHQATAQAAAEAGQLSALGLPGHLAEASAQLGIASTEATPLPTLAAQFAAAHLLLDQLNAAIASPATEVSTLRDLAVQANAAVQAIAGGRSVPQLQQAAIAAAQAAADAVQRAAQSGAARNEIAANAAIALERAQALVRDSFAAEIASMYSAVGSVQSRLAEATEAAAQAQSHIEILDAAIDGMLVARSGAEEADAAATAAAAFRGMAQGRQLAAQAQANFAADVGVLVSNHRLTALAEMQNALDALARCEVSALATTEFANAVNAALGQETPDLNAATTAAAEALGQALLAQYEAGQAHGAAARSDGAANEAHDDATSTAFNQSEALFEDLVELASQDASDAGEASGVAAAAATASAGGASIASGLSSQLQAVFGSSDAMAAVAAAQQLAQDAARRASDAQTAYLAAQAAYQGAMDAGRSSAELTVWGAVRAVALQARQDANTALAAAAEAQRLASIAMAEALAADAAVSGAGFPVLAQVSREAAESAKASALSGMSDILALVQAHQQVLDESGAAVSQALATLGSTLAATEVAQNSASGVATRLTSVRDAVMSFMGSNGPDGVSDSQVQQLLALLLNARNEGLGLALAAGASAADAGAAVAAHAQQIAAGDAANAQAQASSIEAILASAAAALGTGTDDPRLGLLRALHERAVERADDATQSSGQALAAAGGAAVTQDEARAALAALGLFPAWGIGDIASTYGSDVSGAAEAAAAAAQNASDAARGASVLIAVHGVADNAASSIDASEQGIAQSHEARDIAASAASTARSAAAQVSGSGGSNSERAQALASIANASGQVNSLQAQSNSSINLVNGRLDALLAQIASGSLDADAALASLDGARNAASIARENADSAVTVGQGALSVSTQFQEFVISLGVGGAQALEALEAIDSNQLAAAAALRLLAQDHRAEMEAFVGAVLAAAAAGDSVTVNDLAIAALWIRGEADSELARLQDAFAAAQAARADAELAAGEFRDAVDGASGPVMEAAQDAVDAAEQFLRQVLSLQVEIALGERAVDGEIVRRTANLVADDVAARASGIASTIDAMRSAISDYESAASSMAAAVSAAEAARTQAEGKLAQLEQSLASADSRLVSLRTHLSNSERNLAGAEGNLIAAAADGASGLAQQADAARANALSALAGFDALGASASAAILRMDGEVSGSVVHQMALAAQQEAAEDARDAALAAVNGIDQLIEDAGTERGAALGAALVGLCAAGDAFLRVRGARIRRDRIRRGICPVCRYDIRGSVWTSQCPECGELIY